MLELVAEGPDARQRWRCQLPADAEFQLGRDVDVELPVPWDPMISRRHAKLKTEGLNVHVELLPSGRNPIFVKGEEVQSIRLTGGDHFVVGHTAFHITAVDASASSSATEPIEEIAFDRRDLEKVRFNDADKRIEVLTRLPELISGAQSDSELFHRLGNMLLSGVIHAEAAAIVACDDDAVKILHWDRRREAAGTFRPSRRLVQDALQKKRQSVMHAWDGKRHEGATEIAEYTAAAEFDWAFCTPIIVPDAETWGLYVAGRLDLPFVDGRFPDSRGSHLKADVKFAELVAEIVSAVRRVNNLERQQAGFRQFFAPPIIAALGSDFNSPLLEPRECDVTVMFCDLRGFSQKAEAESDDLTGLLERVSQALGVMTEQILKFGGVTGDFLGDAALGFWGWPFATQEAPADACRAALGIRREFEHTRAQKDHPLADFAMGIGIAHGRAVAGKIGTSEQVKVTVFGPVVNLASRLEGMTKQLRVPIVLDEATAKVVKGRLDWSEGRLRRMARVQPYGMETSVLVHELLPPAAELPELSDDQIATYERGVEHFIAGEWEDAYKQLHKMPEDDRAVDFLQIRIAQHNRVAPADWDGVVKLASK